MGRRAFWKWVRNYLGVVFVCLILWLTITSGLRPYFISMIHLLIAARYTSMARAQPEKVGI